MFICFNTIVKYWIYLIFFIYLFIFKSSDQHSNTVLLTVAIKITQNLDMFMKTV